MIKKLLISYIFNSTIEIGIRMSSYKQKISNDDSLELVWVGLLHVSYVVGDWIVPN